MTDQGLEKSPNWRAGRDDRPGNPILWTAFGTLLGLALLYAATRKVEPAALVTTLKAADWPLMLGVLAVTVSFIAFKAWRWKILLGFVPEVRYRDLHSAVYVGLAVNFLLSHVGEFVRTSIVARQTGVAFGAVLASVLVERMMDFVALLALFAAFALFATDLPDIVSLAGVITGLFVIAAIVGIYVLLRPPRWLTALFKTMARLLPVGALHWLTHQLERSRAGFESIRDLSLMTVTVGLSIVQWLLVVAAIGLSAKAVGEPVSLVAAAITFVVIVIGLTLPNPPLQIGTTQFAFALGMSADGTLPSSAVAASIVYTALLILPIMIIGGGLAIRGRSMAVARAH